uniref:Uncharacterized protein n=1 Tax=Knipowitschia caucasica TaxID=637954 RepID=A0AAV2IXI5_KNICA
MRETIQGIVLALPTFLGMEGLAVLVASLHRIPFIVVGPRCPGRGICRDAAKRTDTHSIDVPLVTWDPADMSGIISCPAPHTRQGPDLNIVAGLLTKLEMSDTTCLSVHLYHPGTTKEEHKGEGSEGSRLSFPAGEYVAEELCVIAAKACGK